MQANELRVGNRVIYHDDNIIYVTPEIISAQVHANKTSGHGSWIYPIPLTPEILEKCGFKKSPADNSWYISISELKAEIHFENFRNGFVCVLYCSTGSFIPNDIKYLHQLQNLYFALTGEELNVQL